MHSGFSLTLPLTHHTLRPPRPARQVTISMSSAKGSLKGHGKCSNIGCMDPGKMICSRCKWAGYCSKVCQKAHWKRHKGFCIAATPSESLTVVMVEGKEFWTAEILESSLEALLQLRLSMIVKSKSKLTDHRSQCACASCHGDDRRSDLMLRVLGLLVRTAHRVRIRPHFCSFLWCFFVSFWF